MDRKLSRIGKKIRTEFYRVKLKETPWASWFLPYVGRHISRLKWETFITYEQEFYARCFVEMNVGVFLLDSRLCAKVEESIEVECSMFGHIIGSTTSYSCYAARCNSFIRNGLFFKNVRHLGDVVRKRGQRRFRSYQKIRNKGR